MQRLLCGGWQSQALQPLDSTENDLHKVLHVDLQKRIFFGESFAQLFVLWIPCGFCGRLSMVPIWDRDGKCTTNYYPLSRVTFKLADDDSVEMGLRLSQGDEKENWVQIHSHFLIRSVFSDREMDCFGIFEIRLTTPTKYFLTSLNKVDPVFLLMNRDEEYFHHSQHSQYSVFICLNSWTWLSNIHNERRKWCFEADFL